MIRTAKPTFNKSWTKPIWSVRWTKPIWSVRIQLL